MAKHVELPGISSIVDICQMQRATPCESTRCKSQVIKGQGGLMSPESSLNSCKTGWIWLGYTVTSRTMGGTSWICPDFEIGIDKPLQ